MSTRIAQVHTAPVPCARAPLYWSTRPSAPSSPGPWRSLSGPSPALSLPSGACPSEPVSLPGPGA
eukprot:5603067-Alexandrium_andersonii.AAC.1